ncbi:MAG: hypothetical protein CM15mP18_2820 [Methanobacteriota archaeon]|nr:MAG: hypothetical protein CM15mP18_2820 [Euryarchaeota archaeon]
MKGLTSPFEAWCFDAVVVVRTSHPSRSAWGKVGSRYMMVRSPSPGPCTRLEGGPPKQSDQHKKGKPPGVAEFLPLVFAKRSVKFLRSSQKTRDPGFKPVCTVKGSNR